MIDLAIIPARSGSRGLPRKNIADLGGHSLISWTIRAACVSGVFKRVIVSTDSEEVVAYAKMHGVETPFIRPAYLATAEARSIDVVLHALDNTNTYDGSFALLQPTSPFRSAYHLKQAVRKYLGSEVSSLVSATQGKPLGWQYQETSNGRVQKVIKNSVLPHRRQDSSPVYVLNGAIYLCSASKFRKSESLIFDDTVLYKMNFIDSIDIDYKNDLLLARAIVGSKLRTID